MSEPNPIQNSNVVQFLALLKKDKNDEQLVYYQVLYTPFALFHCAHTSQAGIGTYTDPLFSLPFMNGVSLVLDQMLAWNLASHVKGNWHLVPFNIAYIHWFVDGYVFLMQNCKPTLLTISLST